MIIRFSEQLSGTNASAKGYFAQPLGGYEITDPDDGTIDDNSVQITNLSSTWDSSEGQGLLKIVVTIDGIDYVAMFELPYLE